MSLPKFQDLTMYFLLIGVLGLVLKYLEIGPVAGLSWWLVLSPFALAIAWWAWADGSGYTKRKEVEKMDDRKQKRIDKQRVAMGLSSKKRP
jgi:small Trp-rich protein